MASLAPALNPLSLWRRLTQHIADQSLRFKLVLAFLAITVLSVGIISIVSTYYIRQSLTDRAGETLHNQAVTYGHGAGDVLAQQVNMLRVLAMNKLIQDAIDSSNKEHTGDTNAIIAELQALDKAWVTASDSDPLVRDRLASGIAEDLREFYEAFPDTVEIFITDRYGALVGSAVRPSDYYQADEDWWQAAWNNGQGRIVIDQPDYDASSQSLSTKIVVPVFGHAREQVIGLIRATYRLDALASLLNTTKSTSTMRLQLLLPGGQYVENNQLIELDQESSSRIAAITGHYDEFPYMGAESFVSKAPVTNLSDDELISGLGWHVVVFEDRAAVLAPIRSAAQSTVLISIVVLMLAAILGIGLARVTTAPIKQLTETARQIAAGDLSRRIILQQRDEIGALAESFNTMAETLDGRITAEEQARDEAQRLQQQEMESRQLLEQTVAEYLAFAQQVARGNLTQRLQVRQNGALGQLGEGLNQMVASLHGMTGQIQQASSDIAAAAAEILAATTQQAASGTEQSAAISQTTTTIEEVRTIAEQTARQASEVANESQEMLQVARQGTLAVEETVEGMGQIRQRVEGIAQTILALSDQTQAIGAIIATVNELANQSNLLALNAAIEAARAGEQGRSFAVVAQHVRDLAERSKAATAQVQEILGEIQKATNAAVMVTEEGTKGVETGAQLASRAGEVIHQIAEEVESGAQSNIQMAAAAQQQMAGVEQIGQAMTSIQQATAQALSSTRQAERAAQDLHTLAQSLQKAITTYRL